MNQPSHVGYRGAPTLSDGTVTIRNPVREDVDALVELCRDPQMVRWTTVPDPYARVHAQAWLASGRQGWSSGSRHQWVVTAERRLAGTLELRPEGTGLAEVGYGLAPWARGRGVMAAALRLALGWGFDQAGFDVVHWRAEVGNWPSRRAAWAVGFRVCGTVPGLLEHRGRRVDGWIGALRRDEPLVPAQTWLEPIRVHGRRVSLRGYREDDIPRTVSAWSDDQIRLYLGRGMSTAFGIDDAQRRLEQARADAATGLALFWVIADPGDDRMLGEIRLLISDPHRQHAEIGYWAHPDARGQGLMTEAVQLAVRHALIPVEDGGLGLARVLLRAAAGNVASQRVAEKAGFTRAGIERAGDQLGDGTVVDLTRFELLADELAAGSWTAGR